MAATIGTASHHGPGNHNTPERRSQNEVVLQACFKLTEVILQSRMHFESSSGVLDVNRTTVRERPFFNLEIEEVDLVRERLSSLKADLSQPFRIDIVWDANVDVDFTGAAKSGSSSAQQVLLESWLVRVRDPNTVHNNTSSAAAAGASQTALLRRSYTKLAVFIRSLCVFTRLLPTHSLFQATRNQPMQRISFLLHIGQEDAERNTPAVQFPRQSEWTKHAFPMVETPVGFLDLSVSYATDVSALLVEEEQRAESRTRPRVVMSPEINSNYVPSATDAMSSSFTEVAEKQEIKRDQRGDETKRSELVNEQVRTERRPSVLILGQETSAASTKETTPSQSPVASPPRWQRWTPRNLNLENNSSQSKDPLIPDMLTRATSTPRAIPGSMSARVIGTRASPLGNSGSGRAGETRAISANGIGGQLRQHTYHQQQHGQHHQQQRQHAFGTIRGRSGVGVALGADASGEGGFGITHKSQSVPLTGEVAKVYGSLRDNGDDDERRKGGWGGTHARHDRGLGGGVMGMLNAKECRGSATGTTDTTAIPAPVPIPLSTGRGRSIPIPIPIPIPSAPATRATSVVLNLLSQNSNRGGDDSSDSDSRGAQTDDGRYRSTNATTGSAPLSLLGRRHTPPIVPGADRPDWRSEAPTKRVPSRPPSADVSPSLTPEFQPTSMSPHTPLLAATAVLGIPDSASLPAMELGRLSPSSSPFLSPTTRTFSSSDASSVDARQHQNDMEATLMIGHDCPGSNTEQSRRGRLSRHHSMMLPHTPPIQPGTPELGSAFLAPGQLSGRGANSRPRSGSFVPLPSGNVFFSPSSLGDGITTTNGGLANSNFMSNTITTPPFAPLRIGSVSPLFGTSGATTPVGGPSTWGGSLMTGRPTLYSAGSDGSASGAGAGAGEFAPNSPFIGGMFTGGNSLVRGSHGSVTSQSQSQQPIKGLAWHMRKSSLNALSISPFRDSGQTNTGVGGGEGGVHSPNLSKTYTSELSGTSAGNKFLPPPQSAPHVTMHVPLRIEDATSVPVSAGRGGGSISRGNASVTTLIATTPSPASIGTQHQQQMFAMMQRQQRSHSSSSVGQSHRQSFNLSGSSSRQLQQYPSSSSIIRSNSGVGSSSMVGSVTTSTTSRHIGKHISDLMQQAQENTGWLPWTLTEEEMSNPFGGGSDEEEEEEDDDDIQESSMLVFGEAEDESLGNLASVADLLIQRCEEAPTLQLARVPKAKVGLLGHASWTPNEMDKELSRLVYNYL